MMMRAYLRAGLFIVALCLWVVAESGPTAFAKGRGGGGGRKGGHSGYHQNSRAVGSGAVRGSGHGPSTKPAKSPWAGKTAATQHGGGKRPLSIDQPGGGEHPWSMQRANEQRKLDHRLSTADRLDQVAQRNGNDRLHETAERMRQKAYELHEKRMAKIDSKDPLPTPPDGGGPLPGNSPVDPPHPVDALPDLDQVPELGDVSDAVVPDDPPDLPDASDLPADFGESLSDRIDQAKDRLSDLLDSADKLTGRENALQRQLRNEERKLTHRLQKAQRLWDAYEQGGDERLAEAASRVEQWALDHYEKRLDAIRSFQERHGLPDLVGDQVIP
jgi:hypothetical protein